MVSITITKHPDCLLNPVSADCPPAAAETTPVVVHRAGFTGHALHGQGSLWRAIYPDLTGSRRLFVGLAEFGPGTAPHVFHRHGTEVVGAPGARRRLTYAKDFEEFYFVVEGDGELQWRFADGRGARTGGRRRRRVLPARRGRAPRVQHRHPHDEGAVRRHAAGAGRRAGLTPGPRPPHQTPEPRRRPRCPA